MGHLFGLRDLFGRQVGDLLLSRGGAGGRRLVRGLGLGRLFRAGRGGGAALLRFGQRGLKGAGQAAEIRVEALMGQADGVAAGELAPVSVGHPA